MLLKKLLVSNFKKKFGLVAEEFSPSKKQHYKNKVKVIENFLEEYSRKLDRFKKEILSNTNLFTKLKMFDELDDKLSETKNIIQLLESKFKGDETKEIREKLQSLLISLEETKHNALEAIKKSSKKSKPNYLTKKNELVKYILNTIKKDIINLKGRTKLLKSYYLCSAIKGNLIYSRCVPIKDIPLSGKFVKGYVIISVTIKDDLDGKDLMLGFTLNIPTPGAISGYVIKNKADARNSLLSIAYDYNLDIFNKIVKINPKIKLDRLKDKLNILPNLKYKLDNNVLKVYTKNKNVKFNDLFLDVKLFLGVNSKKDNLRYKKTKYGYEFTVLPKNQLQKLNNSRKIVKNLYRELS